MSDSAWNSQIGTDIGTEWEPQSSPLSENEEMSEPVVEGWEKPERDM